MLEKRAYILLGALLVAGCSTTADGVSDEGLAGDPAAMLTDGAKLNTKGADLVQKGEKRLAEGRSQIREGEARIQAGTELVASVRGEYRDHAGRGGQAQTPKAVGAEAKELRAIEMPNNVANGL